MSELQAAHRAGRVLAAAERYRRACVAGDAAREASSGEACPGHDDAPHAHHSAACEAQFAASVERHDALRALLEAARGDL